MIELTRPQDMLAWSRGRRAAGRRVALVPTMGYLHEGHLRLFDRACDLADEVVASVFVNPLQFEPHEDFERYPRDLERDRRLAAERGVACLFAPATDVMYAKTPAISVAPGTLEDHLCGPRRPGHFSGVLTVVSKLFHIVEPDVAIFGRKDAQQAVMIRRMVEDLSFPLTVVVAPTVREPDGLALSSRNTYLTPEQRRAAPALCRGLKAAHAAFSREIVDPAALLATVRQVVDQERSIALEYVEAVDSETLAPVAQATPTTLLALAARLGPTRLIDNILLGEGVSADELANGPQPRRAS